jgi:polyphenol oxidase
LNRREDPSPNPPLLAAENLKAGGVTHGFFLRQGGVSEGIYASLNCGRGSNDSTACVEENRTRAAAWLGTVSPALVGPRQIHSAKTIVAGKPWDPQAAPEGDAIVTAERGLAIGVLTADCVPILLSDPKAGVIAAAHAGWRGAKAGVAESAIATMERLGACPSHIAAAVGPAISQRAYEVSHEFKAALLEDDARTAKYFSEIAGTKPHFDLTGYVKSRLLCCGVRNIQDIGLCTYENESILFSYRRSLHKGEPDYGRQISAILMS